MRNRLLLSLVTAASFLGACSRDKQKQEDPTPQPVVERGYVRVVNTLAVGANSSIYQGPVRLFVDGREEGPTAAPGAAAPYQGVAVGDRQLQVMLPSSGSGSGWVQFGARTIIKDARYSLFIYNSGSFTSARVVEEPTLPTVEAGKAHIRVVNLAAGLTPVRIEEAQAGAPLYANAEWGRVTGYQAVDARAYSLVVSRTNGNQDQLFTQTLALQPGKAYSLVLRGSAQANAAPEMLAFDVVVDE